MSCCSEPSLMMGAKMLRNSLVLVYVLHYIVNIKAVGMRAEEDLLHCLQESFGMRCHNIIFNVVFWCLVKLHQKYL